MKSRIAALTLVGCLAAASTPAAMAAYCGLGASLSNHAACQKPACCQKSAPCCEWVCEKVMKTMTRTCYEWVDENKTETVYDTVIDRKCVQEMDRIPETHYRDEEFTYHRTVYETHTREVPYTVNRPVYETRLKEVTYVEHIPSYETRKCSIPYKVYRPVQEHRTRSLCYSVPRTVHYTKTIQVPCGHWEERVEEHPGPLVCEWVQEPGCWIDTPCQKGSCQKGVCQKECGRIYQPGKCRMIQRQCPPVRCCRRVWVPSFREKVIPCCRTEYEIFTKEVPYTFTRLVAETRSYEQEYTVTRMMGVTRTKTVRCEVARMVSEQQMRTETYDVARSVPEIGIRRVPFTTYREVPCTRTVCTPRKVPREVCYTIRKCVPRTETYQVPCYIYKQVPCGKAPCQKPCQKPCCLQAIENGALLAVKILTDDVEVAVSKADAAGPNQTPVTVVSHKSIVESAFDTAAEDTELAASCFVDGLEHYRAGRFTAAAPHFEQASQAAPRDARYAYFHALALHQSDRPAEAQQKLETAVCLEKAAPIANWGRLMERVQGRPRLWVEEARAAL